MEDLEGGGSSRLGTIGALVVVGSGQHERLTFQNGLETKTCGNHIDFRDHCQVFSRSPEHNAARSC